MYVLLVYDVSVEKVAKVHKLLKGYLHWVQNSVFEGELTESQIEEVKAQLKKVVQDQPHSVLLYIARNSKWIDRQSIGSEKNTTDNII